MNPCFPPLIAELGSIEKYIITALAVAGGFLIGFVLTHLAFKLIAKLVFKTQAPEGLTRIARLAGGIAAAILVFILLTGPGGLGFGGGGGGDGQEPNEGDNKQSPKNEPRKDDPKVDPKSKVTPKVAGDEQLVVQILHADTPQGRFFQLENQSQPLTLDEILKKIEDQPREGGKPVKLVRILPIDAEYSYAAADALAGRLERIGIEFSRPKQKANPPK